MALKVYVSGMSGNKEVKKRQQRVLMILDSKNIKYELVDITEPGKESEKDTMQTKSSSNGATVSDPNPRHPLPPQIFNGEDYCGDYDAFDLANEIDTLDQFLKLVPADTTSVSTAQIELKNGEKETTDAAPAEGTEDNKENEENKENEAIEDSSKEVEVVAAVESEANPDIETTNPDVETSSPVVETANPDVETANPDVETASPVVETANPDIETANPDVETASPVVETANLDVETANTDVETANDSTGASDKPKEEETPSEEQIKETVTDDEKPIDSNEEKLKNDNEVLQDVNPNSEQAEVTPEKSENE